MEFSAGLRFIYNSYLIIIMVQPKAAVIEKLKQLTKHENVVLVDRGNTAIYEALKIAKKRNDKRYVLIQDQGGWLSYEKLAKKAGLEVKRLKTENGVIEDIGELDDVCCVLYTQPSGYCLKQDSERIHHSVKIINASITVIMDCSGSIGGELCDGRFADIIVASFRKWKAVNVGSGGMISSDFDMDIDESFDEKFIDLLDKRLSDVRDRITYLRKLCNKVAFDLNDLEVLYDKGIVVIVKYKNPEDKNKIINYCKDNGYGFTECPREIRVLDNAISVEVKRLDT